MPRPTISLLSKNDIELIHEKALEVLEVIGVRIESRRVVNLLKSYGLEVSEGNVVKFPRDLVESKVKDCPHEFTLYDREGKPRLLVGGDRTYFNPGSAATKILDLRQNTIRDPTLWDLRDIAILVNELENIDAQSTAVVPHEFPPETRDRVRLYPLLKYSTKPIVTGAFTVDGVHDMVKLLSIFISDLDKRPIAIFDVCPSPPLKWSEVTVENLVDCAKYGLPIEIISMPSLGATSPVTIAGALVQHHAEVLSGIVIAQLVRKGVPVVYGGSPSTFDMRYGTPNIVAPEALLVSLAYVEIAKYLNLLTHTYMALSDTILLDYQSGVETGISALVACLRGINVVSGPGMLEHESTQCLEKLVLDNEVCGLVRRFSRGFNIGIEELAIDLLRDVGPGGTFLSKKHTVKHFKKEIYHPHILLRYDMREWMRRGSPSLLERAKQEVEQLLKRGTRELPPSDLLQELNRAINGILRKFGITVRELP
ncbi:MAG: hypothetical protein DRJ40_09900 [Thermoprotei archaeon]|nr:MAG: hypothetical protein DRJ40_09900 [Thermoprotei archaeon]